MRSRTLHLVSQIVAATGVVVGIPAIGVGADVGQLHVPTAFAPGRNLVPQNGEAEETLSITPITDDTPGAVETITERYEDGKAKIERQVTLDTGGNYVNHGEWKMFSHSGEVVAEGHYDMGKRVGIWTRMIGRQDSPELSEFPFTRFKTPFQSQANFADDKMEGEWTIIDAAKHKCMQVSLVGGKRNGTVTTFLPNGKTYRQISYDNGVPVGDALEIDKTGELKTAATYIDGRKQITKTTYFKHGRQKQTEVDYLAATTVEKTPDDFWNLRFAQYGSQGEDLRHGPSKAWFENGIVKQEGFYQYGKKCGTFTYRHQNGQVAVTGEYKDDAPADVWVWWHENGQKAAIGKYEAGATIGEWRWWNDDGKLVQQKICDGTEIAGNDQQKVIEVGQLPGSQKIVK